MLSLIFTYIFSILIANCNDINQLRNDYNSINSEEKLEQFIKKYKSYSCDKSIPYLASATMMRAQYAFSPIRKLNYFNDGKAKLEKYIMKNPASIDARYVRIMIQGTIPAFLNYNSDLKKDIRFVKENIDRSDLSFDIKNTILKNINNLKQ